MGLPPGVETVTLTAGEPLVLPDGTPYRGRLIFSGPGVVTIGADDVVLGGAVEAPLVDGMFSVTLCATDATGMSPTGWTYEVIGMFTNAPGWTRHVSLPKASPTVQLADVIVPDPVAGTYTVLVDGSTLLAKASDLSDVPDKAAARTNLGLGGAAVLNVGTVGGTVAAGNDSRLSDARTPTPHAASHGSGGTDPVALAQSQITGLVAALAALLPLAGGTLSGDLTVNGHNLTVQRADGTGAYRLRVTGGGLDFEIGGLDVLFSTWSNADFTGAQNTVLRLEPAGPHLIGRVQIGTSPYNLVHDIDAGTGVAGVGGKNGLANIRLAGFKATAGAPTTGTWTAGDVVLDASGGWHLCQAGGTPGTWT